MQRTDLAGADDGHVLERVTDAEVLYDGEAENGHHGGQTERRRDEERRRQTDD